MGGQSLKRSGKYLTVEKLAGGTSGRGRSMHLETTAVDLDRSVDSGATAYVRLGEKGQSLARSGKSGGSGRIRKARIEDPNAYFVNAARN